MGTIKSYLRETIKSQLVGSLKSYLLATVKSYLMATMQCYLEFESYLVAAAITTRVLFIPFSQMAGFVLTNLLLLVFFGKMLAGSLGVEDWGTTSFFLSTDTGTSKAGRWTELGFRPALLLRLPVLALVLATLPVGDGLECFIGQ